MDTRCRPSRDPGTSRLDFFQQFLKHPLQIGSIMPSSRFLERRVVAAAGVPSANVIVELGPGIGGTTRAILREMPRRARLLCIEVNSHFCGFLRSIEDERLIVHQGSACDLEQILSDYDLAMPDAVISGIPFSTMPRGQGTRVIEAVSSSLGPRGRFVAYQVSNRVATLAQPVLGKARPAVEFLNFPPMQVFQWRKCAAPTDEPL